MDHWLIWVMPYLIQAPFHLQADYVASSPLPAIPKRQFTSCLSYTLPPGAPFGQVKFYRVSPNLFYTEFIYEEFLIHSPKAHTRELGLIGCEGTWYTKQLLFFCNKYNYLPPLLVPLTPWPNCPQESVVTGESTSTQLFGGCPMLYRLILEVAKLIGVFYIALTALFDPMVLANGPWVLLEKSLPYVVKLAPILWKALPTGLGGCLPTSPPDPSPVWIPATACEP
ncbi:hypothetical protein DSO57_1020128 [Entomophthora muscae]|uniref:Uncharacterized protein n=1 Tax=Entomophthora muscae TaxID=34485 RepID=A0ACC2TF38_9FUNG|nr:hypothetical protein DSO57_1020128 [Entomophthora muscae]